MTKEEGLYISIGQKLGAVQSQMFGKPCFKVNGKAFMSLFDEEAVFKLTGAVHETALSLKGARMFDPSGKKRPMKEWVQVPFSHSEHWEKFAKAAYGYVKETSEKS
jgi:hypothetical protein